MSDVKMTREEVLKLLNEMAPISDESYLKLAKLMAEYECCFEHILGVDDDKLIRFVKNWVELVIFRVKDRACFSEHVTSAACLLKVLGAIDDDDLGVERATLTEDMVAYLYFLGAEKYQGYDEKEVLQHLLVPHFLGRCEHYASRREPSEVLLKSTWELYNSVGILYNAITHSSIDAVTKSTSFMIGAKLPAEVVEIVDKPDATEELWKEIRGWIDHCEKLLKVLAELDVLAALKAALNAV